MISPYAEFAPCYAPDGTILYFTSSRVPLRDMLQESEVTGLGTNNLYMIKQDAAGKWSRPDSVPGSVNTPEDEGTPSITSDGNTLYYLSLIHILYPTATHPTPTDKSGAVELVV